MAIDACVLLRIRDAAAFEAALAAKRGLAGSANRLGDDTVSMFTGMRFHDDDVQLALRQWLHALLGPALEQIIHADARGFFIYPDIVEPRATRYDALVAELDGCGRFIDAAPPGEGELAAYQAKRRADFAATEAAVARGDPSAIARPPIGFEAMPVARGDGQGRGDADDEPPIDLGALLRGVKLDDVDAASELEELRRRLRGVKDPPS